MKRPCDDCGEMFEKTGKFQTLCHKCKGSKKHRGGMPIKNLKGGKLKNDK